MGKRRIHAMLAVVIMGLILGACTDAGLTAFTIVTPEADTVQALPDEQSTEAASSETQTSGLVSDDAQDHLRWGRASLEEGRIAYSLAHLDRAVELDPELMEAHWYRAIPVIYGHDLGMMFPDYRIGTLYNETGSFDEARPYLDVLIESQPDDGSLYLLRAFVNQRDGTPDAELLAADLSKARELLPDSSLPYELEAMALMESDEEVDEARLQSLLDEAEKRGGSLAATEQVLELFNREFIAPDGFVGISDEPFTSVEDAAGLLSTVTKPGFWEQAELDRAMQIIAAVRPDLVETLTPHLERLKADPDYTAGYAYRGFANYYALNLLWELGLSASSAPNPLLDPIDRAMNYDTVDDTPTDLSIVDDMTLEEMHLTYVGAAYLRGVVQSDIYSYILAEETSEWILESTESILAQLTVQMAQEMGVEPEYVHAVLAPAAESLITMHDDMPGMQHLTAALEDWIEYETRIGQKGATSEWDPAGQTPADLVSDLIAGTQVGIKYSNIGWLPGSLGFMGMGVQIPELDELAEIWSGDMALPAELAQYEPETRIYPGAGGLVGICYQENGHFVLDIASEDVSYVAAVDSCRNGSLSIAPGGTQIAVISDDSVQIHDLANGDVLKELQHPEVLQRVAYSPDGSRMVTGAGYISDHTVRIWDTKTWEEQYTSDPDEIGWTKDLAFSEDGEQIILMRQEDVLFVDADTGEVVHRLATPTEADILAPAPVVSKDGELALTIEGLDGYSANPGEIRLWDVESGENLHSTAYSREGVGSIAFNPDATQFAAVGDDLLRVYDTDSGTLLMLAGLPAVSSDVAFTEDGLLVVGLRGGTVQIWDTESGELVSEIQLPQTAE